MASKEAFDFFGRDKTILPMRRYLMASTKEADAMLNNEIIPQIEEIDNIDKDMFAMNQNKSPIDDYADAKLIEEMMDMDIDEYKRKQKEKKEEEREQKKRKQTEKKMIVKKE